MVFHEIYGKYYDCVARILREATQGGLTRRKLYQIVSQRAFAESGMTIPDALLDGQWQLMDGMESVLEHPPRMPLTELQKRWLKSLLQDPRIRLFDPPEAGLEDVEPLYDPRVFVYFDRYSDGDPYEDSGYIRNFRTMLQAIRERRKVEITYTNQWGRVSSYSCQPVRMEYSQKDDKFRARAWQKGLAVTINLARVQECVLLDETAGNRGDWQDPDAMRTLVLELSDWRNTLERAMLHFSHLEKTAEKLDEKHYRLVMKYNSQDETELLIRVLSFGPLVKVTEPAHFVELMRQRIEKQADLRTQ